MLQTFLPPPPGPLRPLCASLNYDRRAMLVLSSLHQVKENVNSVVKGLQAAEGLQAQWAYRHIISVITEAVLLLLAYLTN
jgi:hypothetical protein